MCFLLVFLIGAIFSRHQAEGLRSCESNPCLNGGTCTEDRSGKFHCNCAIEFIGEICQHPNPCYLRSGPLCQNGGTCVVKRSSSGDPGFFCMCPPEFSHSLCEIPTANPCNPSPCLNGGKCLLVSLDEYTCYCPPGFSGRNCEGNKSCRISNPCVHGNCVHMGNGTTQCICDPGFAGRKCDTPSNACTSSPCSNGGSCVSNNSANYTCICDSGYTGTRCEVNNDSGNCLQKSGNGICDIECNSQQGDYDGGDCTLGIVDPWASCDPSLRCRDLHNNSRCDEECNKPQCLYDGFDCVPKSVSCFRDKHCEANHNNGVCDMECHNFQCGWDGEDCVEDPPLLASGILKFVLRMDVQKFREKKALFARYLSQQLRTTVRIKLDHQGIAMVYPWDVKADPAKASGSSYIYPHSADGVLVYLEIDNSKCSGGSGSQCFGTASQAAGFLAASVSENEDSVFPLVRVSSLEGPSPPVNVPTNSNYYFVAAIVAVALGALVGVLVRGKTKKARGKTWFPPGSLNSTLEPGLQPASLGDIKSAFPHWSEEVLPQQGVNPSETALHSAARFDYAEAAERLLSAGADPNAPDHSGRTPLHTAVAADSPDVLGILMRNRSTNLNARCYNGWTPAILAARLSIEGVLLQLVELGADVNAADNVGRTPLHWAAAVNNTDAISCLLLHGADKDAQDSKNETPIFVAAREGCYRAAHILLTHNAKTNIRDHYDRLPRDIAKERLHEDIVLLLDQHVPIPDPAESRSSSQNPSKRPELASLDARRNRTKNVKKQPAAIKAASTAPFTVFPGGLYSQETISSSGDVTALPGSSKPLPLISPPSSGSVELAPQHNADAVSFANPHWQNHVTCDDVCQSTLNPQNYSAPLSVDSNSETSVFQNSYQPGSFQVPREYLLQPLSYSHFAPQQREVSYRESFLTPSPESCSQWPFSSAPSSV